MKTLLLMRHAKSDQINGDTDEQQRPLTPKGERRAMEMGAWIQKKEMIPQFILASTSQRACRTAQLVAEASGYAGEFRFEETLYMAEADELLKVLQGLPDEIERVMIVGHNPGLESLIPLLAHKVEALPFAGVAVLRLPVKKWAALKPKTKAKLVDLWRAKKISSKVDVTPIGEESPAAVEA